MTANLHPLNLLSNLRMRSRGDGSASKRIEPIYRDLSSVYTLLGAVEIEVEHALDNIGQFPDLAPEDIEPVVALLTSASIMNQARRQQLGSLLQFPKPEAAKCDT